jgi:hypothetical protein
VNDDDGWDFEEQICIQYYDFWIYNFNASVVVG